MAVTKHRSYIWGEKNLVIPRDEKRTHHLSHRLSLFVGLAACSSVLAAAHPGAPFSYRSFSETVGSPYSAAFILLFFSVRLLLVLDAQGSCLNWL